MKNKIFLLLLSSAPLISAPAAAQSFGLGLIGGLNIAQLHPSESGTDGASYSTLFGYKAGTVLDFGLSKHFGLRLEPMFLQKGAKRKSIFFDGNEPLTLKSDIQLSYLEAPVLFTFKLGKGRIRPYLLAGGAASYLLAAKERFSDGYFLPTGNVDIKDDLKNFDFELSGGAGVSFAIGRGSVFMEGRYSHGLVNIRQTKEGGLTTSGLQIMAGYSIPLFSQQAAQAAPCNCQNLRFGNQNPMFFVLAGQPHPLKPNLQTVSVQIINIDVVITCQNQNNPNNNCNGRISVAAEAKNWTDIPLNGNPVPFQPAAVGPANPAVIDCWGICTGQEVATGGNSLISLTLNNSLRVSGELFITVDPGGCPLNDPPRIYKLKIDTNPPPPPPGVPIVGPFLVVAESDLDGDGLTFLQEENQNTLPDKWDSDNDGVSDANDKFPNDPFRHK